MGGTIGAPTTDRPIVHATIPFTVFSPLLFSMTFVAGRAISERWGLSILLYQSRFKDDFSIDFPSICLYLSFFLSFGRRMWNEPLPKTGSPMHFARSSPAELLRWFEGRP